MDEDSDDRAAAEESIDAEEPGAGEAEAPGQEPVQAAAVSRPRIEGVEAAVAAGLVPPQEEEPRPFPRHLASSARGESSEVTGAVELPDWTDPPTREVPRVLLREGEPEGPTIPGPVWRESEHDFDQDEEAFAEIVSGSVPIVEHDLVPRAADLDLEEVPGPPAPPLLRPRTEELQRIPAPAVGAEPSLPSGRVSFAGRASHRREQPQAHGRERPEAQERMQRRIPQKAVVRTATGVGVGAVALVCFLLGPVASLAVAALVLFLASAEYFSALRRARYQPAALLGLVAAPGFAVAGYERGPLGVAVAMAVAVVAVMVWYLVGVTRRSVTANISVSLFGIGWIAFLGSFAGLLLDPSAFPLRHGVAYLLGAAEVTVAYDVGGYVVGNLLGRHPLAPALSPRKTWEGLVGGIVATLLVGLFVTASMHPWTLSRAAALAVVAAVVAPAGDLVESMVKRDLKVKDMGRLLPAHGGVLDRIDALLFVLPATYIIVRLMHG